MASNFSFRTFMVFFLAFSLTLEATLGGTECENLSHETCSFAVSSGGKRCVLEKRVKRSGEEEYTCKTSDIEAENLKDHIETDQCIKACGLDRNSLGISSDSLLESTFTHKLCSPHCYHFCPNVVDLYFNLAAGEGVFLPKLCEVEGVNARRGMAELRSSGIVAPGPVHSVELAASPPINPVELSAVAPSPN
ncbi:hypothetical protein PHAVU_007G071100 [Phaseolus vulgaris]|uniref:PAR1 protein n=1 Tax=Phaseolus vulgaris TaxID=3885 RepID=V7BC25_PHAVU|nr:hypothetical protein PHAVU_007G071100g [Phaseolus vulgaris]ESW15417.1 hypothetical protein PHAVU_007G071100g [Phaseolus vulgaris]